jgi:hypothetical protein
MAMQALSVRVPETDADEVKATAERNGRSIQEELRARIIRRSDDDFGSPEARATVRLVANIAETVAGSFKPGLEPAEVLALVKASLDNLMESLKSAGVTTGLSPRRVEVAKFVASSMMLHLTAPQPKETPEEEWGAIRAALPLPSID